MQLKNGFHLITNSNILASIPNHNNNQPFSNVNLVVNESVGDFIGGIDDPRATVYSLFENGLAVDERTGASIGDLTPIGNENLNFSPNEYGFLELLSSDDEENDGFSATSCSSDSDDGGAPDDDQLDVKVEDEEEEEEEEPQKPISCVTCGCYGLVGEFHDPRHCTYDCSLITRVNDTKMRLQQEAEEEMQKKQDQVVEEQVASQVKVEEEQQQHENVEEQEQPHLLRNLAPLELFKHPALPTGGNPFKVDDLLEAIDPEHACFFCPVRVVETVGFRLLLKFIGYPDKYNFWANADSPDIFPVNWTTTYKTHQLHFHAPPNFTWSSYTSANPNHRVAPSTNFAHISALLTQAESRVRVGMKLEAVDIRNKNLICVATVSCVMGDRFLIHFDSWDSLYDYWTTLDSARVHPVGYCKQHGIEITPPHCYETPSEFDWDEYLRKTASVPVPKELFRPRPPVAFQVGQELEVIDKRSPRLLRLAKIAAMPSPHTLTLTFPLLNSSTYDYEVNDLSPDLHPVGWGVVTGHPVVDDMRAAGVTSDSTTCPNHQVCVSSSSVRGPEFSSHTKSRDCPYSTANLNEITTFTDRVVIFEDKYYDYLSQSNEENKHVDAELDPPPPKKLCVADKPTHHHHHLLHHATSMTTLQPRNSLLPQPINFSASGSTTSSNPPPPIPKKQEILTWSHDRISKLVQSLCSNLPTAQVVADQFRNNLIDGESFLMLTQSDMTEALGIKLGPAVKIYNLIRLIDLNK